MAIAINGSGTITGISTGGIPDGVVDTDVLAADAVTSAKIANGTIVDADVNASAAIADSKLTGTTCKAWVNFNGTGTVAIRASYNVSSITDNGTGDYTVNFTSALADANYAAVITGQPNTADGIVAANGQCDFSVVGTTGGSALPSSSGFRIWIGYAGTNPRDVSSLFAAVFR